jgi:hypothetical protein
LMGQPAKAKSKCKSKSKCRSFDSAEERFAQDDRYIICASLGVTGFDKGLHKCRSFDSAEERFAQDDIGGVGCHGSWLVGKNHGRVGSWALPGTGIRIRGTQISRM